MIRLYLGLIKSFASKSKKSVEDVESVWKDTEDHVMSNSKYQKLPKSRRFAIVNSVVQKRLGLNENENDHQPIPTDHKQKRIERQKSKAFKREVLKSGDYLKKDKKSLTEQLIHESYHEILMESIKDVLCEGVIRHVDGKWKIWGKNTKKYWKPDYTSREDALSALRAYEFKKHGG